MQYELHYGLNQATETSTDRLTIDPAGRERRLVRVSATVAEDWGHGGEGQGGCCLYQLANYAALSILTILPLSRYVFYVRKNIQ